MAAGGPPAATASAPLQVITCTGGHQVEDVDEGELRATANRIVEAAADRLRGTRPELTVTTSVDVPLPPFLSVNVTRTV